MGTLFSPKTKTDTKHDPRPINKKPKTRAERFEELIDLLQLQDCEPSCEEENINIKTRTDNKILVGDTVLVCVPLHNESYCHGIVLGIGQYVSKNTILYSVKLIKLSSSHRYHQGKVCLFSVTDIRKVLKRNYNTPYVTINDCITIADGSVVTVRYIGRRLTKSLNDSGIDITNGTDWSRWTIHEHKNIDSMYLADDDNIYYACETTYSQHVTVNSIRYFFNTANATSYTKLISECKLNNLRRESRLMLLINGYLMKHTFIVTDVTNLIKKYVPETIGFVIRATCPAQIYSYGTCPTSTEIAEYNAYNVNGDIYGPTIRFEFQSSYKYRGRTSKVVVEGLYTFECDGEIGYPIYYPSWRDAEYDKYTKYKYEIDHLISHISSISISKLSNNYKTIHISSIISNISKAYDQPEQAVLKQMKKNKIRLHGITHNRISSLSDEFTVYKTDKQLIYENKERIKYIYERDKDMVVCFDGEGMVLMADNSRKKVCELKVGDQVVSFPNNISTIEYCVVSRTNNKIPMVKLINENENNYFWITHQHPILVDRVSLKGYDIDTKKFSWLYTLNCDELKNCNLQWILPKEYNGYVFRYQECIYNFILREYHTLNINGFWCCTLGHNYKGDVIEHNLWGNYDNITKYLKQRADVDQTVSVFH